MTRLNSEVAYNATLERIEELLLLVNDNTPADDKNMIELGILSDLAADYEDEFYPIGRGIQQIAII